MYPFQRPFSRLIPVFFFLALLFSLNAHANSCNTGIPPQQDASQQIYTGAPDASGGDVSLWGAGSGLGGFDSYANYGDYVMYAGLDFGAGKSTIELNVATGNTYNQTLELWVDGLPGQGQKIGQVIVQPTGSWGNYVTYTGTVNVCGVHDLYLIPVTDPWWEGLGNLMWFRFSGSTNPPVEEYSLTVQNGAGDGDYQAGAQVTVNADPAPAGQTFSVWTGDTANLADANAASTTLTMPASAVSISATYANTPPSSCTPSGHTAQQSAFEQTYTGAPDASGGDVSLWGAGSGMGGFDDYNTYGDYVMYAGLDFGNGASSMELNIANGNNYNQTLELWIYGLPGQGQKIGELSVPPTGGWGTYVTYTGNVDVCSVHDLYLIPVTTHWEALGNLMWFRFIQGNTAPQNYTLTVNSGTGDGSYPSGTSVNISADTAPVGQQFAQWTGDTGGIADLNAASTILTMPAAATTVTATYEDIPVINYSLIVNSGSGDGSYPSGTSVNISANAPPAGQQFAQWMGDTGGIADLNAASTTLTMPAAATMVTATYEDIPVTNYNLTVNSGSGDGSYPSGASVNISANAAPAGQQFAQWMGDTGGIADLNAASTTLTMPAAATTVTATYEDIPVINYNLTVNNGSGDGSYPSGTKVNISANVPPAGQQFAQWTGDTGGIANIYAASTILTMPASAVSITASYEDIQPSNCTPSGHTAQHGAFDQTYTGAPDAWGGDVSLWGAGSGMGGFDDYNTYGDYVMYAGLDFGDGANSMELNVANGNNHTQTLELWIDGLPGQGQKIGEVSVPPVGGWGTYVTYTGDVDVCSVHDLYLVPVTTNWEALGNLMWFRFIPGNTNPQNHTLTVNSGTGGGNYAAGASVNISANAAPAGQQFAQWTGDTSGIADIYSASTTLTMPAAATTVTATYEDIPVINYSLIVNSGSGDGSYPSGTSVNISANAPPAGQQFAQWMGDTGGIADLNAASTTLTMPAAATTVTATYEDIPVINYSLTVNNGIGSGSYAVGQTVAINANAPPAGQAFDQWTGDVAYAVNPHAANTTVTMPASNISLTASYVQAQYNLTVNNGSGDGDYAQGAVVSITADAAPTGQHFKAWTGDTGGIADVNAASTSLTMPASATSITASYELDTPSNCVETGQTPQLSAFDQQYTGAPDAASSEVSLWGPGSGMGNFDDHYLYGDWVMYAGVDFSTGANEVTVHAAVDSSAPQILEFWVDGLPNGGGTKIGEATINSTGSWSTYIDHSGVVDVCSVHDLYLIGRSNDPYAGIGNLIWFSFKNTLSNLSPTASLSATPTSGQAPLVVEFDASASTDPEGLNLAARWDFDYDGANFEMQQDNGPLYLNTQAVFFKPGTHTAAVEIRDPGDATSIDTITIQVDGVDAGDKQTVLVGQSAIMQGLVSPSSSVTWGTVSGPGAANFANPNDLNTSVSFPAGKGHYVLKMTAHGLGDSDTVQIEVVNAQPVIPIARRVDWSRAGVEGGIPDNIPVRTQLTAQDLASDPVNAIQNAIDSAAAPGVVLLPAGTYQLSSSSNQQVIRMRDGIVLRGRGMDKTQLVFHAPNLHYQGAINIYGSIGGVEYAVNAGYVEGSQRLHMANVGNLAVGDTIWLYQDNDPVLMSTERSDSGVGWNADWAQKSMSQLGRIASLSGNTIELDAPLRRSYSSTKNPRLVRVNTIKNVGIEDLAIHRQQDGANGFNVAIASAENSWIRNVEFAYAKRAHVWMSTSRFITLESNYGHDVLALGSGGNGYGFVTGKATSDALIWNNILQRQGTALMVKEGSNGVVVAYNYVLDRHNATQGTTDVSLHGHYPYANLVEGNHIDASRTTDWWGPGGNYITYFRNRVRAAEGHLGTRGISVGDRTHYVNIVGNSFLNGVSGVSIEDDDLHRCHFTLLEGNLFNNAIEWNDLPASTIPASRFLHQAPHFWGSTPWPVVGADVDSAGATPIPAEAWHQRILANGSAVPFD